MTNYLGSAAIAVVAALVAWQPAVAEPLNPAHLPADAKWVLHVDFDAFRDTVIAERLAKKRPEMLKAVNRWFEKELGLNPKEDLGSLTMFSDTYQEHTGAAILLADYDQDTLRETIEQKVEEKPESWQGATLYTMKKKDVAAAVVLLDGAIVLAPSPERAKQTVALIKGRGKSLDGQQSPLLGKVPTGAVLYGAAVELQKISEHEGVFPILRQHKQVVYAVGNDGQEVFEQAEFTAVSPEVAQNMEQALRGGVALMTVWAADDQALTRAAKNVKITRKGDKVASHYRTDVADFEKFLDALMGRFQQWKQAATDEDRPEDHIRSAKPGR